MHYYWGWGGFWWMWVIWIALLAWGVAMWMPLVRGRGHGAFGAVRGTPIEELQHRLARGEITIEDYEARLAVLRRDHRVR